MANRHGGTDHLKLFPSPRLRVGQAIVDVARREVYVPSEVSPADQRALAHIAWLQAMTANGK
jgi:hypothetical protein